MNRDCTWVLPTGVLCEWPEWVHDGARIVHPYCPPEGRIAAEARAARVADIEAIVRAYYAHVDAVDWLSESIEDYIREFAERYAAHEKQT